MMSSMSSLPFGTMVTIDLINQSTVAMATGRKIREFTEVQTALFVERIYVYFLASVGMVGNFLCFVTLVFTSLRNTSACIYMAVIAVLDSIILAIGVCTVINLRIGHTAFFMQNSWNCGFYFLLFYSSIHSAVLILLAMTVDRFVVVKFPLKAPRLCTPRSAIRVITGIVIFAVALNFHILFNRRLVPAGRLDDPLRCWYPKGPIENFMTKVYTIIDATIYSFIPLVSLITLNLLIIRELRRARKFSKQFTERQDGDFSSNAKKSKAGSKNADVDRSTREAKTANSVTASTVKTKANTNITLMLLLVSFCFLALSSPLMIVLLYQRYYGPAKTIEMRAQLFTILAYARITMFSNHGMNFFLYSISGRRFRQELKQLLVHLWQLC